MTETTISHLVAGWRVWRLPEWRDSPAGLSVNECIGEAAQNSAAAHFLRLQTAVAQARAEVSPDRAEELQAEAAVASLDFADSVGERLADHLGASAESARWDAVRIFWCRFMDLALSASAGGSA